MRPPQEPHGSLGTAEKLGRSGPLTFVTVQSEIRQDGRPAIIDEKDIVYRLPNTALPAATKDDLPPTPTPASGGSLFLDVDSVMLFRFSALTYNAHRIHYDLRYTKQTEGYAGLVIHGPLQALMMGELFRRDGVTMIGHEYAYRFVAPAVGEQRLTAMRESEKSLVSAHVRNAAGEVTAISSVRSLSE